MEGFDILGTVKACLYIQATLLFILTVIFIRVHQEMNNDISGKTDDAQIANDGQPLVKFVIFSTTFCLMLSIAILTLI